ncbi:MAG: type II toxin-antitoxin system VapC family toxin [Puniceicoccaceae bacterium]
MIELDTHVVAWLHAGELKQIPRKVRARLDEEELLICPVVLLELEYLREIGRLTVTADRIFADLAAEIGLRIADGSFPGVIQESLRQNWTPDPFDRIIAAHAIVTGHALASKDKQLRRHCPVAFWG